MGSKRCSVVLVPDRSNLVSHMVTQCKRGLYARNRCSLKSRTLHLLLRSRGACKTNSSISRVLLELETLCCGSSTTSDRSRTILGFENEKSVRSTLWRSQSHLERRGLNGCCATTQGRYRGTILTRSTSLWRDSSGSCGRIQLLDAHHKG